MHLMDAKFRQLGIISSLLTLACASSSLEAETKLLASSNNRSTIEIRLINDEPVAGLQFVLRSSPNIVLQEICRSGRTSRGNWTVASNLVNDSTLKVVVVSTDTSYFADGDGTVAEVSISRSENASAEETVSFTGVVAADPKGQLVDVTAQGLILNTQRTASGISSSDFSFEQNYPNPFNPSTRITYALRIDAHVTLTIYDISGRELSRLVDQYQTKGTYAVGWNSLENRWDQLASGTYLARLQVGDVVTTRKMLLTK